MARISVTARRDGTQLVKVMGSMGISSYDRQVLKFLSEHGGYETGTVARNVSGCIGHRHSAWVRQILLNLEKRGFVRKSDDKKPVLWERTPEGTDFFNQSSRDSVGHDQK